MYLIITFTLNQDVSSGIQIPIGSPDVCYFVIGVTTLCGSGGATTMWIYSAARCNSPSVSSGSARP